MDKGATIESVTIYLVDYVRKTKIPIGYLEERRKGDRGDNKIGLLKLARKRYAKTPDVAFRICLGTR